jgi:hypothetical protein
MMWMRKMTVVAVIAATVSTPALAQRQNQNFEGGDGRQLIAATSVKTRLTQHVSVDQNCQAQHLTVTLTSPPQHGRVFIQRETVQTPRMNRNGGEARCAGARASGVVIYYQSVRGFKGEDSFSYTRLSADNAADRHNGEVTRTVTVE